MDYLIYLLFTLTGILSYLEKLMPEEMAVPNSSVSSFVGSGGM